MVVLFRQHHLACYVPLAQAVNLLDLLLRLKCRLIVKFRTLNTTFYLCKSLPVLFDFVLQSIKMHRSTAERSTLKAGEAMTDHVVIHLILQYAVGLSELRLTIFLQHYLPMLISLRDV